MPFTVATHNKILDKVLKNTDFTPSTTLYLSLHTANPTDSGTSEVTGGTYGRQTVAFGTAATSANANTGVVTFTLMPATTVTHYGIWSASSGGTLWAYYQLTTSRTTLAGDSVSFAIGSLTNTMA